MKNIFTNNFSSCKERTSDGLRTDIRRTIDGQSTDIRRTSDGHVTDMCATSNEHESNMNRTSIEHRSNMNGRRMGEMRFAKFAKFAEFAKVYFARVAAVVMMILTLGIGNAWGKDITVYAVGGEFFQDWDEANSTMKIDYNTNSGWTYNQDMTRDSHTYNGKSIYMYTFQTSSGGNVIFKHYKNGTWKQDYGAGGWNGDASYMNGKLYLGWKENAHQWIDYTYDAPETYTITLDNQWATTAGTETVTAIYGSYTNLDRAITKPTKYGYTFGGYYTGINGSGSLLINTDGNFVGLDGYTDGQKNWIRHEDVTLYAKWTDTATYPTLKLKGNWGWDAPVNFNHNGHGVYTVSKRVAGVSGNVQFVIRDETHNLEYKWHGYNAGGNGGQYLDRVSDDIKADGASCPTVSGANSDKYPNFQFDLDAETNVTWTVTWIDETHVTVRVQADGCTPYPTLKLKSNFNAIEDADTWSYNEMMSRDGNVYTKEQRLSPSQNPTKHWQFVIADGNGDDKYKWGVNGATAAGNVVNDYITLWEKGGDEYPNFTFELSVQCDVTFTVTYLADNNVTVSISAVPVFPVYTGLSVARNIDAAADMPTISATTVNQNSSVNVVAQDANEGYQWDRWTSTNGTFGDASAMHTTFTPSANNAVAVAHYTEKPAQPWKIKGSFDGWKVHDLTGTVSSATYTYTGLAASTTYYFGLENPSSTFFKGGSKITSSNTSTTLGTDGSNAQFETTIAGDYTFSVDYTNATAPVVTVTYPTPLPHVAEAYYIYLGQSLTLAEGVTAVTYDATDTENNIPAYYYDNLSQTTKQYERVGALTIDGRQVTGAKLGKYQIAVTGGDRATATVYVYRYYAKYPWGACDMEGEAYNKMWKWAAMDYAGGNTLKVYGLYSADVQGHANLGWDYYYDWDGVYKFDGSAIPNLHPGYDNSNAGVWVDSSTDAKDHGGSAYREIDKPAGMNCEKYIKLTYTPDHPINGTETPALNGSQFSASDGTSEVEANLKPLHYGVYPALSGTVSHNASGDKVEQGTKVTFYAEAADGYIFRGWYNNAGCTGEAITSGVAGNLYTVEVPADGVNAYAKFSSICTAVAIHMAGDQNKNLEVGETNQLYVTYTPETPDYGGAVKSWESSNTAVITIDASGLVTAIGSGTTTITVTTTNDVTATKQITVNSGECTSWYVHAWNGGNIRDYCMHQEGEANEWRTDEVRLPSASDDEKVIVLKVGETPSKKADWNNNWVPMVGQQVNSCKHDGNQYYAGHDALGYYRIIVKDNDAQNTENYGLAFQPTYVMIMGKDITSSSKDNPIEFTRVSGENYQTGLVQVPVGYKTDATYKYYVGTKRYAGSSNSPWIYDGKSSLDALNRVSGLSSTDLGGTYGKFSINADWCDANFYCTFIPYYTYVLKNDDESIFFLAPGVPSNAAEKGTTFHSAVPEKTGYTCIGWNRAKNQTTADVTLGAQYSFWKDLDVFYPVWQANQYTITYKESDNSAYAGSNGASLPATHTYGMATNLVDGVRDGYIFDGWYTDPELTNSVTTLAADGYTDNITLYAKWDTPCVPSTFTLMHGLDTMGTFEATENANVYSVVVEFKNDNINGQYIVDNCGNRYGNGQLDAGGCLTLTQGVSATYNTGGASQDKHWKLTFNSVTKKLCLDSKAEEDKFTITVVDTEKECQLNQTGIEEGQAVTVVYTCELPADKHLTGYTATKTSDGSAITLSNFAFDSETNTLTFTMPAYNVTLTAVWESDCTPIITWTLPVNTTDNPSATGSTTDVTNITSVSGLNNAGELAYTTEAKENLTGKIAVPATKEDAKYLYFTFNVKSGKLFIADEIVVKMQPVSGSASMDIVISDNHGHSLSKTFADITSGVIHTLRWTLTESEKVTLALGGTCTLKLYCYGSAETYHLGTPITICGSIAGDLTINTGETHTISSDTEAYSKVTVKGGATLAVTGGATLNVGELYLTGGLLDGGGYDVPRVYVENGSTLTKTEPTVFLDLSINTDNWYPLAVPYPVKINGESGTEANMEGYKVRYAPYGLNNYNGDLNSFAKYSTDGTGQVIIKTYNGASRAETAVDHGNWKGIAYNETLTPGIGYIIKAVTVGGKAVIRFEMNTSTPASNTVAVTAHGKDVPGLEERHKGWNMLGVPYMSCFGTDGGFTGEENLSYGETMIQDGKIIIGHTEARYVTVPTYNFSEYIQTRVADAKLLPAWSFFVQAGTSGTLTFLADHQSANAPWRINEEMSSEPEIETAIVLSRGAKSDKTGLILHNDYSADYEIGADLEKMFGDGYTLATYTIMNGTRLAFNAMDRATSTQIIPLGYRAPEEGEYTYSLDSRYSTEDIERIDLIDYETGALTNLLSSSYTFTTGRMQSDERFAINVTYSRKVSTGVDDGVAPGKTDVEKVIINEVLYIIRDGRMYDAQGKMVK